jgi:hypothetical protein
VIARTHVAFKPSSPSRIRNDLDDRAVGSSSSRHLGHRRRLRLKEGLKLVEVGVQRSEVA